MRLIFLSLLVCQTSLAMPDTSCPWSSRPGDEVYPSPRLVIVGPAGVGKSSLANALLGCDPKALDGCLFPVCPDSPYVCTNQTTVGTGCWLGTDEPFTVTDTPGFGVSSDRDRSLMQEMSLVLDIKLGYTNTILLVLEVNTELSSGLVDMLNTFTSTLGADWWDSVVIGVSKWKYNRDMIDERRVNCKHYPENCRDEEWFVREVNSWLKDMFELQRDLPVVFIDAFSKIQENGNYLDVIQKKHFDEETDELWDLATESGRKFQFRTIEDDLRKNKEMTERLSSLALEMNTMKSQMQDLESDQIIKDQRITTLVQKISNLDSDKIIKDQKISDMESDKIIQDQRINELETKITTLENDKTTKDRKIRSLENDKSSKDLRLTTLGNRITTLETDKKKMETKITTLENDKTTKDRKIQSLENDKSSKDRRLTTLGNRISTLETDKEKMETKITTLENDKEKMETKIATLETDKEVIETKINTLETDKEKMVTKIATLETDKEVIETKINTLETDKEKMETKITTLETDKEVIETKINTLETDKQKMETKITTLETDKEKMETKIATLETDKEKMETKINTLETDKEKMETKITILETDKEKMETKITTLETDKEKMETKITTLETDKEKMETKINTLETDKEKMETKINTLETDKEKMETKINTLETDKTSKDRIIRSLENDKSSKDQRLKKIEDKPYAFQCAYRPMWTEADPVITWYSFITNSMSGVTGGFSLPTGQFTVGHSGVWEVSYSMKSYTTSGEWITAYLYINGRKLTESQYNTYYRNSEGFVGSQGSRTLFIKLNKGDKVTLQTTKLTGALYENTLCFHLAQPF